MKREYTVIFGLLASGLAVESSVSAAFITSEAQFQSAISPGYYLNDFSGPPVAQSIPALPIVIPSPALFSGGSPLFSYSISASAGGLVKVNPYYSSVNQAVSTVYASSALVATFNGSNIKAIGGNIFLTSDPGEAITGNLSVTIKLSDNSVFTQNSFPGGFLGFISPNNATIASLSILSVNPGSTLLDLSYPTLGHLYVAAVPEPATSVAGAAALLILGFSLAPKKRPLNGSTTI